MQRITQDLKGGRKVVTDDGTKVNVFSIPLKTAYVTDETRRLSQEYDLGAHPGLVPSSLGSAGTESFVGALFRAYNLVGELCGFPRGEIDAYAVSGGDRVGRTGRLEPELLEPRMVEGIDVLFPTEKLLKNQRVPKRK